MANRRMVSLDVVDTDAFLEMPVSSQLLYFHLNARADDDGFLDNPKKIARFVGTNEDDLKVLISKKFIIPMERGICVIKHWRINNFIRKDIYEETRYIDLRRTLFIRKNGAYTLNENGESVKLPDGHFTLDNIKDLIDKINVNESLTGRQPSIGKGSIGKVREDKKTYGEFKNVYLTDEEYQKLVGALNQNAVEGLIEQLSGYMESKGKRYKSHYATIQVWARRRIDDHVKEIKSKKSTVVF